MALFTDGIHVSIADLALYESSVESVAATEGIAIEPKIRVCQDHVGEALEEFLLLEAVGADGRPTLGTSQVVVTSAIRRWLESRTLEAIFRDAFHSQLNDRYRQKLARYEAESEAAARRALDSGVGIVRYPMERAAAPTVQPMAGTLASGFYQIRVAWVAASGAVGSWSAPTAFVSAGTEIPSVRSVDPPAGASAWLVSVAREGLSARLQTPSGLMLGATWTPVAVALDQGPVTLTDGQSPDYFLRRTRRILRG